jgi:hypothetical protein
MNCQCGKEIPEKRTQLGYRDCVECSTVERVGCIDIVYHKTGNTIEITDRETAEKIRKLSRRNAKGIMVGMKPSPKSETWKPPKNFNGQRLLERAVKPDPAQFEADGARAMEILESEGFSAAVAWLQKRVSDLWLTPVQMGRIRRILEALQPPPPEEPKPKQSWYSKFEPREQKSEVDDEIADAFKYWKR